MNNIHRIIISLVFVILIVIVIVWWRSEGTPRPTVSAVEDDDMKTGQINDFKPIIKELLDVDPIQEIQVVPQLNLTVSNVTKSKGQYEFVCTSTVAEPTIIKGSKPGNGYLCVFASSDNKPPQLQPILMYSILDPEIPQLKDNNKPFTIKTSAKGNYTDVQLVSNFPLADDKFEFLFENGKKFSKPYYVTLVE